MEENYIGTITYDITMNCNLRCKHCYNSEYLDVGHEIELDIKKIIDGFSKIKFESIVIQGGEPLLVKNLEDLIKEFTQMNVNVFITTNAILLSKERTVRLIKSGLKGIFFSVESASALINDSIRGEGTFDIFFTNVKNFMSIYLTLFKKKFIPPLRIALSCTASSINFDTDKKILNMFYFAKELGISDITFNFLLNYGASRNLSYNEQITEFKLANSIVRISKEFPEIYIQLPLKFIQHEYLKKWYGSDINIHGAKGKCPAGERIVYVDSELKMFPCIWLPRINKEKKFIIDNTICLLDEIPEERFDTFIKYKNQCIIVFKECENCKYKNNCIPICPCLGNSEEKVESIGKLCPTRKEINEYKK